MASRSFDLSRITIRRGLTLVLIAQAALAVFLVLSDVEARWLPRLGGDENLPTGPATPGDQVRRYDPERTAPDFTDRRPPPGVELPSDMPPRLQFDMIEAEGMGEVLLVLGPIESGDAGRFDSYLASLPALPQTVAFNSPGGVVREALSIGRSIRAAEADTVMLPGMACLSACPYIFAAGTDRTVSRASALGMHQQYYETPGYMPVFLAVEGIQYGQGDTMAYLIDMGIDPALMLFSLNTPPEEIYLLVEEELLESGLATAMID